MNLKLSLSLSSLIAFSLFSSQPSAQTLQEAIQKTINENPQVQSAKSERSAIEQQVSQAKSAYFPTIDIAAGIGEEHSTNPTTRFRGYGTTTYTRQESSIQLKQMLFDGLATPSEINRQQARMNASAYTLFGQSEITALNAVEAYINVLRREKLLSLAKENLALHQKTNNQILLRSKRGVGKRADAEQSSGRLALAEKNTISEVGNLKDAETAFLKVIGTLPFHLSPIQAPTGALPENIDMAVEQAVANHPILKSANADIDSAFAQHKTAKAAYLPRIDLEASASHNVNMDGIRGRNEDAMAMLRLKYNIFNGGKDVARRKETAKRINQAKNIRDNTYRQVVESMRLSWVAYQTIKKQLIFFRLHQNASIKSYAAYQKQFDIGQRTLLDLLDTANEMFVSKSAYTNAKYDEIYSQYRILASKGGLNKHLKIKLPDGAKTL